MFRTVRTFANPFTRTAILMYAWTHRRSIMRWGRSLWVELKRPKMIQPDRLQIIGRVLWAITRDEQLARAKQLRQVRLDGNVLVVDTSPRWKGTARLVDELDDIPGIAAITDPNGNVLAGSITSTAM